MKRHIEIFALDAKNINKVSCKSCPKSCASRDQAELTGELLYNHLLALFGSEMDITLHDYTNGDQDAVLERQNELYKLNGIPRMVNKILINPLASKIWPSVVIDGRIRSEGTLIDATRIEALLQV